MAEIHAIGLSSFKRGAIGTGGGMGGTLTAVPDIVKGSCSFKTTEQGVTPFYAENKPRPVEAIANGGIIETVDVAFYDISPTLLAEYLGGTAVAAVPSPAAAAYYEAGSTIPQIEESFEIITKNLVKLEIVRGLVTSMIEWNLGDEGTFNLKLKITILEPTDGTSPAYTKTMPL